MSEVATINNVEFARSAGTLEGSLPVGSLTRLVDLLASPEGMLEYVLKGVVGRDGKPYLALRLRGTVMVTCQRCLAPVALPLDVSGDILIDTGSFVPSDTEDGELPDMIDADERMVVNTFIEDEVILALPMVPRHDPALCGDVAVRDRQQATENPFAKLATLKSQSKKTD